MSTYNYHELAAGEETRLVRLKPAKELKDELVCELINVSLDSMPEFDALSYVWKNSAHRTTDEMTEEEKERKCSAVTYDGENAINYSLTWEELGRSEVDELCGMYYQLGGERADGTILLDGYAFKVGFELEEAMRRLRYDDRDRLVWIDALCINQTDMIERNVHVKKMGQIYGLADTVVIWLGEYVPEPHLALGVLDLLNKKLPAFISAAEQIAHGSVKDAFLNDRDIRKAYWDQFAQFLRRAWFNRVWVLQEVVNAKTAVVYAAHFQLTWDYFSGIINWLRENGCETPLLAGGSLACIPTIQMIIRLSHLKKNAKTCRLPRLIDILQDSRSTKSTYPIDKVYGVLGLISEQEASTIEVDYNLDARELYTKIATAELMKGLDVLGFCTKPEKPSDLSCPSWVPDWTQQCYHFPFSRLRSRVRGRAAGDSVPRFQIEGKILEITGRIVDTIEAVEPYREIPKGSKPGELKLNNPERFFNTETVEKPERFSVETMFLDHLGNYYALSIRWLQSAISIAFPTGEMTEDSYDALWRTFCWNTTTKGTPIPDDYVDYFSAWVKAIIQTEDGTMLDTVKWTAEDILRTRRFDEVFGTKCFNRRFYRSEEGRFGWCPDQSTAGDKVCILNGAPVPFVIRPTESGSFELIGDAYLHGIMDGEAMDLEEVGIRLV